MKVKVFVLILIFLFLVSCEKSFSPEIPDIPEKAKLFLTEKDLLLSTDSSGGIIRIWGVIRNIGNVIAKNVSVNITIFDEDSCIIWGPETHFVCAQLNQNQEVEFHKDWNEIDANIIHRANYRSSYASIRAISD